MNSLTKLIMFFTVLGVFGAGLFFFPQSPLHYSKITTIIVQQPASEPSDAMTEENMSSEDIQNTVSDDQVVEDVEPELNQ